MGGGKVVLTSLVHGTYLRLISVCILIKDAPKANIIDRGITSSIPPPRLVRRRWNLGSTKCFMTERNASPSDNATMIGVPAESFGNVAPYFFYLLKRGRKG